MPSQRRPPNLRRLLGKLSLRSRKKYDSRLLQLPVELLEEILSHLEPASLESVCLVSRELQPIAVPFLFRAVTLDFARGLQFMRSIDGNPSLAKHVHSITLHEDHMATLEHQVKYAAYTKRLESVIATCEKLRNLTIKAPNIRDALSSMAFSNDVNMRALAGKEKPFQTYFVPILQPSCLANLQTCELNLSDGTGWNLAQRDCIFFHPRLKRLSILGAIIPELISFTESHGHTTPLEELSLMCCDISPKALGKISSVPRALRRFTYIGSPHQRMCGSGVNTSMHHKLYFEALEPQASSLVYLNVSFWKRKVLDTPVMNFQSFSSLESLTIQPAILQGNSQDFFNLTPFTSNPFPTSLERLMLFDVRLMFLPSLEANYVSSLGRWILDGSLPNFTRLTFANPDEAARIPPPQIPPDLEAAFEGKVVERVEFIKHRRFPISCDCCEYNMGTWEMVF
ncbi:hypothetical protein ASPCAL03183 [Aspergillus calidoustus]|uniref:F-box domain-containing protein n=1 Tax=Aspergillus calidoustus TaxID=454130 RepID=A0A0U5GPE2_ASPCI|nr:hypothetical protein ASPCAL03183 [Aspergillus calidoustus]